LTWLSSPEEGEREIYLGALIEPEKALCYQMLRDFYLNRPEAKRQRSVREAMVLFNQAFLAKSKLWVERRWEPITHLIGVITDALSRRIVGNSSGRVLRACAKAGFWRAFFSCDGVANVSQPMDDSAA
jgi:hypothetical protein